MAKAKQSDSNIIVLASLLALAVVIGIVIAWLYFRDDGRPVAQVNYASFGPVVVRGAEFSIKTTIAIQTRNADASAIESHRAELDMALQKALSEADSNRIRGPGGLAYLQQTLQLAANAALPAHNVQQVLLTDFVIQSN